MTKSNIITNSIDTNIIKTITDYLISLSTNQNIYFDKIALIFGGKRPALFITKELSKKINKPFYPPTFFTMEEFLDYILLQKKTFYSLKDLDAYYLIYEITKTVAPEMLQNKTNFIQFLPWAKEIFAFIENLDLEDIDSKNLYTIQRSAQIGYDVPNNINYMLQKIVQIRNVFHSKLDELNLFSRGKKYLVASNLSQECNLSKFDKIIFVTPFYLHETEIKVIKNLQKKYSDKIVLFFCGSSKEWSVLKNVEVNLNLQIVSTDNTNVKTNINFYSGFDSHSQIGIVRELLKTIPKNELDSTVIVLPDETNIFPLLFEISSVIEELNISLGYPITHSTIFSLLTTLFDAHITKKEFYYTKNYLNIIMHPIIKSLNFGEPAEVNSVLVHTIEKLLLGIKKCSIAGSITLDLSEIENLDLLYEDCFLSLKSMDYNVTKLQIKNLIKNLHERLFYSWEKIDSLDSCIKNLSDFLLLLRENILLKEYPFNLKIIDLLLDLCNELKISFINTSKNNLFSKEEMYKFILDMISTKKIAFKGSPLKGVQILGLLETRSLSFDNVIFLDLNETFFPKIKIYEPLIPREVMLNLGINRLEKEEEIQKYHFKRLIYSSKNVFLIYAKNNLTERSRFVEELLWDKQKRLNSICEEQVPTAVFRTELLTKEFVIKKEKNIVSYLENFVYSTSSIDTYIKCPLQFYFKYVLKLSEKESLIDELEPKEIGTFIHQLLKETFTPYVNKKLIIDHNFKNYFYSLFEKSFNETFLKIMKSDSYLLKEVLLFWLEKFLNIEVSRENEIEKILYLESSFNYTHYIGNKKFNFKSIVDRIDLLKTQEILIIDYKSGSKPDIMNTDLNKYKDKNLSRDFIRKTIKSFQLPIYINIIQQQLKLKNVNAVLYCIKEKKQNLAYFFKPELTEKQKDEVINLTIHMLNYILTEIINPDIPFVPDKKNLKNCQYCHFTGLCK